MDESKPLPVKPGHSTPRPRYVPGGLVWAIVALAIGALVYVRAADPIGDEAVLNILTLILAFIAAMALLIWFAFVSSYPPRLRMATVGVIAVSIGAFFLFNKIERVSGSLIPAFRSRFAPPRDALLEQPVALVDAEMVDLTRAGHGSFPQFLGPNRNLVVRGAKLDRRWDQYPPRLLWKQPIGAGWSGFVAAGGFAITLEQRGDQELVTCYEVATGKLRWSHAEAGRHETVLGGVGPRSTPTIAGDKVYVVTALGVLLCLNGKDGMPLWRVDLVEKFGSDHATDAKVIAWGRSGSPLLVNGLVVVPAGGSADKPVSLAAFDAESGELRWSGGKTQISYASPVLAKLGGGEQIVSVNENNATGHDPETGKVLWTADWPGSSSANASTSQPQVLPGNRVLLSKGYSVGAKMLKVTQDGDSWTTEVLWENHRVLKTKFTNVVVDPVTNHAYALSDGLLECIDLETGERAWRGQRYGQGQILAVDSLLLVMGENTGEVALVNLTPQAFDEVARFQALEGQTWNNLCLAGRYLLVRNSQEAACYELKVEE